MPKAKTKLPPIPRPGKGKAETRQAAAGQALTPAGPDLSHIAEGLRGMATPLADVVFMVGNAVRHPDKQIEEIRASLREFGQVEPLIVNRRESPAVAIGGNGRLQAMLAEGWTHGAVLYVDLDRKRANALSIALNRTADGREWDKDALNKLMSDIAVQDNDLDAMMASLKDEMQQAEEDAAGLQEIQLKPPPQIAWLLLGIPLDRFGEVREHVAALQEASAIHVESNRNIETQHEDGQPEPAAQAQDSAVDDPESGD